MRRTAAMMTVLLLWATGVSPIEASDPADFRLPFDEPAASRAPASTAVNSLTIGHTSEIETDWNSLQPVDRPSTFMQVAMTPESTSGTWVLVAPYVWATAQKGTIGARGLTAPVDLSLADLIDIIPDLNGAAMAHVEVGKGNKGLIFDAMIMQVGLTEGLPGGGRVDFETGSTIIETLGMLRIVDVPDAEAGRSLVTMDLLGGARYYQVLNELRITPAVGPTLQADVTKDWVDLVFGARGAVTITSGLSGFLRADLAGFGIGTSSDLTWNLTTGAEYTCPSMPGSSLVLGYRVLAIDESQKQGANQFVYDVTLHGPFAAIAFRF